MNLKLQLDDGIISLNSKSGIEKESSKLKKHQRGSILVEIILNGDLMMHELLLILMLSPPSLSLSLSLQLLVYDLQANWIKIKSQIKVTSFHNLYFLHHLLVVHHRELLLVTTIQRIPCSIHPSITIISIIVLQFNQN